MLLELESNPHPSIMLEVPPIYQVERSIEKRRWARNQSWDTHVGPIVFIDQGGRDRLMCGAEADEGASTQILLYIYNFRHKCFYKEIEQLDFLIIY